MPPLHTQHTQHTQHMTFAICTEASPHEMVLPDGCDMVAVKCHRDTLKDPGNPYNFKAALLESSIGVNARNCYCRAVLTSKSGSHYPVFNHINLLLHKQLLSFFRVIW